MDTKYKLREFVLKWKSTDRKRTKPKFFYITPNSWKDSDSNEFTKMCMSKIICVKSSSTDEATLTFKILRMAYSGVFTSVSKTDPFKLQFENEVINPDFTLVYSLEKTLKRFVYSKTYLVAGPDVIDEKGFHQHYTEPITNLLKEDKDTRFVISDSNTFDYRIQKFLIGKTDNVRVFHMFNVPRNNAGNFKTVGHFTTTYKKNAAMTRASTNDLGVIYTDNEKRKMFGRKYSAYKKTKMELNAERRKKFSRMYK